MVGLFVADGFEEIETLTVVDLLRRKNIDVSIVSIEKDKLVKGAHAIGVEADLMLCEFDFDQCEMIILPGGMPGTKNLNNCQLLKDEIMKANSKGIWICAICAAPMILGHLGLLNKKKCTIYPGMENYLTDGIPKDQGVVIDNNIVTGRGPGKAMDFALTIVELLTDKKQREKLEGDLVYDRL